MRVLSATARAERGQVLVEFAVVLPVLIMIILGIIFFGRYMDYSNQMTQLAEQGARAAALASNPSTTLSLQAYIQSQAQPELRDGSSDVSTAAQVYIYYPTGQTGTNIVGNSIRVCVTATFQLPFISTSASPAESATMRIEQLDTGSPVPFTPNTPPGSSGCPTS